MTETILQTFDLTRRFGKFTAVDAVDLQVSRGEIFALLGPNGAGKTTTVKMLTTLLKPTSGTALVGGWDIRRRPADVRRIIGYVPQMISVDGTLTAYENLLLFSRLYDIPAHEREARIQETLELAGLTDVADRLVRTYSGGMIRRLEIGQALMHHPLVLFLDEPTVGLDPLARDAVWERILHVRDLEQMSVVITTHYMDEAERLADRLAIMHLGRIQALGTSAELKASTGDPQATLDEVFAYYSGGELDTGGGFRDAARARRVAQRLG